MKQLTLPVKHSLKFYGQLSWDLDIDERVSTFFEGQTMVTIIFNERQRKTRRVDYTRRRMYLTANTDHIPYGGFVTFTNIHPQISQVEPRRRGTEGGNLMIECQCTPPERASRC